MQIRTHASLALATVLFARHFASTAGLDLEWKTLPKLKTKYASVIAPPKGAAIVEKKDTVTVHATGIVKDTNKKFWSTKDPGQQPFT